MIRLITISRRNLSVLLKLQAVLWVVFLLPSNYSLGTTYYINDGSSTNDIYCTALGNGSNNGLSPASPLPSISSVLSLYGPSGSNTIASGDVFYIDAGYYLSVDNALAINVDNLSFIGAGSLLTLFDNGPCGSCSGEFFAYITGNNVTIQGMTLTRYQNDAGNGGKSITVDGVTGVVIDDVNMISGIDNGDAALVVFSNSSITYKNSSASCNASNYGGGVQVEGSNITMNIENCIISGNSKTTGYLGGGLLILGTLNVTVTVTNSTISNNQAGTGGGIYVEGATLDIQNSCISDNALNQSSAYGGGMAVGYNATVNVSNCSFTGNTATPSSADGGAIGVFAQNSLITIEQCYFDGNTANGSGDAIYVDRAYSTSTAIVNVNESIFTSSPTQSLYRKSDATLNLTNSGTPQTDSGSSAITGNTNSQTLGMPSTNCPSNSTPCQFSVLPVELIHFDAFCEEVGVRLNWSTASERNNDYFVVERTKEDGLFYQIAIIDGAGNSDGLIQYQYQDRNNNSGSYYYRLVQVDYDGKKTKYSTLSINYDCGGEGLLVSYNNGDLQFFNLRDKIESISIYTTSGLLVFEAESPNLLGNHTRLDRELSNGIYLVSVISNNEISTSKIYVND